MGPGRTFAAAFTAVLALAIPGTAAALSSNADLASLTVSGVTLDQSFSAATTNYTATTTGLTQVDVTATVADNTATLTVNTLAATSGSPFTVNPLNYGANTIGVKVTAQDGTTKTYYIDITNLVPGSAPGAPTIGTATAGNTQATVAFTAPASNGGSAITGYTVTASPGGATGTGTSSPITVTGLTNGTAYTFTVTATNASGTGSASAASNSVTPRASQTITFNNPGSKSFGTTPTLTATSTSSLTVTFSSATTGVCTITSGGALTLVSAGTCTINADQAGNSSFLAAAQVTQSFTVNAVVPGAPTVGAVSAGDTQATVAFTAPASNGGATITGYTVTSNPGGLTGTGSSSPITISGLTNGTAYTFTVTATNSAGTGSASGPSNNVTPKSAQTITFNNPGAKTFGTTPTLTATSDSSLTVAFTSATTGVCTITSGGALTFVSAGSCTINADQAGNGSFLAATTVSQTFTVNAVAPATPTIGTATAGNGQATVSFTPGSTGGAAVTYTVTGSPGGSQTGSSSPITVTGLTNGTAYTFTVTATNTAGASTASVASNSVTPTAPAPPSNNANLSALSLSAGSLSPAFAAGTTSYTASVDSSVASITVTPSAADGAATVKVDGATVISGAASSPISLNVGANTITVDVTAQDGVTTKSYNLTVIRRGSINTDLSGLSLSSGTLSPAFAASGLIYTASVDNAVTSITVTPTTADSAATVTVNGTAVASGSASGAIALNVGDNTISVRTTAASGAQKIYTITVTRAEAGGLSGLGLTAGTLSPAFAAGTTSYTVSVGSSVSFIAVTPTTTDRTVKVTVNGTAAASGSVSDEIALKVGANTISVVTTAGDGAQKTYTLVVTRAPGLSSLYLVYRDRAGFKTAPLSQLFDPDVTSYTGSVDGTVNSVIVKATPSSGGSVIIAGGQAHTSETSQDVSLVDGDNTITVTAGDTAGNTKVYTVVITRKSPITITSSGSLAATTGKAFSVKFSHTGGPGTYSFSVRGILPVGVSFTGGGTLSGTPKKAGDYPITVKVAESKGATGSADFTLSIKDPVKLSASLPSTTAKGSQVSAKFTATGGSGSYTFKSDQFLPGLTLAADGTVSGTLTGNGGATYTATVTVADADGRTDSATLSLKVDDVLPDVTQTNVFVIPLSHSSRPPPTQVKVSVPSSIAQLGSTTVAGGIGGGLTGGTFTRLGQPVAAPSGGMTGHGGQTVSGSQGAAASTLEATFTYQPVANFMGVDRYVVTFYGTDGQSASIALVFQVAGQAPDLTMKVAANGSLSLNPTASLIGGPFNGLQVITPPGAGVFSASGLQFAYTPKGVAVGTTTTFTYAVELGFGLSAPGTVTISVAPAVSAAALSATTLAGRPVSLDLTAKAQGGPFSSAAVVSLTPSQAGTAQVRSTGAGTYALDFKPADTFSGQAVVRYSLTANGATAEADATITVAPRPDPSLDPTVRAIVAASDDAVRTFARSQVDNFNRRLETLRSGPGRGGFDMRLGVSTPTDGQDPRDALQSSSGRSAANPDDPNGTSRTGFGGRTSDRRLSEAALRNDPAAGSDDAKAAPGRAVPNQDQPSKLGAWVGGTIQIGHVDPTTKRRDYNLTTSGVSGGVDYRLSDQLVLGAGVGYGQDWTHIGAGDSKLTADTRVGVAYASYLPAKGVFVDGVLGYGQLGFDIARFSSDANSLFTGARNGDTVFGSLRAGFDRTHGGLHVSPYGEVSFIEGRLGAFVEAGDPGYALSYAGQDVKSLASTLGLKLEERTKISPDWYLSPRLRLEWRHEFDQSGDQVLTYADWVGSPHYVISANQFGRDDLSVELGGRLQLNPHMALDLGYRAFFASGSRSSAWTLRLENNF